ncbi:S1 RNA-binding domain-containing protein [bacterium]|nr:S1 RNA-binding domain-containing protein [bacterium]
MDENEDIYQDSVEKASEGWWASVMEEDGCYSQVQENKQQLLSLEEKKEQQLEDRAGDETDWESVESLFENENVVTGTVIDFNKGGLLVCGDKFQGFVPVSHLDDVLTLESDDERIEKLENYVGCRLFLKVIECDQRRGRIVLSERAAQTEPGQRQKLLDDLSVGQKVKGRVTNITDFGVFVDLGGVEGLVHISELSWGRVIHPKNHLKINDMIDVLILQVNRNQCRVSLSVKQLKPNPWKDVLQRYPKGKTLNGTITEIVKYGAFARLEDGLEGLIHVSELGAHSDEALSDLFSEGQNVQVEVVLVDAEKQRMSLRLVN